MLPFNLNQVSRILPPSPESGYESQPIDNVLEPFQKPEVTPETFWSDCPLARYYISKEDQMAPDIPSSIPQDILEHQQEAIPDYLELRKWDNCKTYQSDPQAFFWDQNMHDPVPEYSGTFSSVSSSRGSTTQLSTTTFPMESSEESGHGTDEDDQDTEAYASNSSNENFGNSCISNSKENSSVNSLKDLCKICGDRSTGYHYKVMACEGCKGFFRRSVDRSSKYKCHRNDSCDIDRITRNQCQACRFKKCLQMGMCKESVRRDQNHKRKLKPSDEFTSYLPEMDDSQMALVTEVLDIHRLTYIPTDIRPDRWSNPPNASNNPDVVLWEEESDLSQAGIFRAIQFAKKVPGFSSLGTEDQVALLRHACIEIMVLRFCTRFFPELDGFYFPSGNSMSRKAVQEHFGPLANLMIDMSETLIKLSIDDTELALMQSLCLLSSARPGLKYRQQIQHFEEQMSTALMVHVCNRRLTCPLALHEIVQKLFSLRLMGRIGSEIILAPQQVTPTETTG